MDTGAIEGLAVEVYRRVGLEPDAPADMFRLARLLYGADALEYDAFLPDQACTYVVAGRRRIALRRGLGFEESHHAISHEIGHGLLDELGVDGSETETLCDRIGAALLAPVPAVRALVRAFGRDHEAIADEVVATQTWAALRIAEVIGMARAVVTPRRVHARGSLAVVRQDRLRWLARAARPGRGVERARLTDDPHRVVVDIDRPGRWA